MAVNATAQRIQFSKKLSKLVLIFWAAYRIATLVVAIFRPEITTGLTTLTTGIDDAAMVVVISYTVNSATEKVAVNYFNTKTKGAAKENANEGTGTEENEKEGGNG